MEGSFTLTRFTPAAGLASAALQAGFRSGAKGTHSSRTMMLADLTAVMSAVGPSAAAADYERAITQGNCLGKATAATRKLSAQRLSEVYSLDPAVRVFRVFRTLWYQDQNGRPLLALLLVLARDPLLAATARPVTSLPPGGEFQREPLRIAIQQAASGRFNESILGKVVRNTASSWTQTGHLHGRALKKRQAVRATAAVASFAIYLAYLAGFRGNDIFTSLWFGVLDCGPGRARELAIEAKQMGLLDLRIGGDVVDIRLDRLDPALARS